MVLLWVEIWDYGCVYTLLSCHKKIHEMMSCYVTRWRRVCCVGACVRWPEGGVDVQMDKNMFVI